MDVAGENQSEAGIFPSSVVAPDPWSAYVGGTEDVVGHVAASLFLKDNWEVLASATKSVTLAPSGPTEGQVFSYRSAADHIVADFVRNRQRVTDKADRSTDPLFLLLRAEFADHAGRVSHEIDDIKKTTSFSNQIIYAAVAGVLVSLFVVLATAIPGSIEAMGNAWKTFISNQ